MPGASRFRRRFAMRKILLGTTGVVGAAGAVGRIDGKR
jgi:hypothetical protein